MKDYLRLVGDFISQVGFPIYVAVLLLWRDNSRHADNLKAMQQIAELMRKHQCSYPLPTAHGRHK